MSTASEATVLIERVLREMSNLMFTLAACAACQLALFGLALLAYVRWQVPACDLIVLLRECRLMPSRRDCGEPPLQAQGKPVKDESVGRITFALELGIDVGDLELAGGLLFIGPETAASTGRRNPGNPGNPA